MARPRRCSARAGWSASSKRPRTSTTSTRASRPPARTSPTPPFRRPTRTRRPASRRLATETGARAVGLLARLRLLAVRAGVRGVHGRLLLRPEALPALDDADLGRDGAPLAEHADAGRHAQQAAPDRLARASRSPRRRDRRGREDTNYSLGSVLNHVLLHQTVIGQEAIAQMEMAGEGARRRRRVRRRGLELRRAGVPVPARRAARREQDRASSRRSRRPARRSRGARTATTSATPPGSRR